MNKLFYKGMPIFTYCKENNINYNKVYSRIKKGYSIKDAIKEVSLNETAKSKYMYDENTTVYKYCMLNNLDYKVVRERIKNGASIQDALLDKLPNKRRNFSRTKYLVNYKGEELPLTSALKEFYKDNNLALTTSSTSLGKINDETALQEAFENYCQKILKKYHRI